MWENDSEQISRSLRRSSLSHVEFKYGQLIFKQGEYHSQIQFKVFSDNFNQKSQKFVKVELVRPSGGAQLGAIG